MKLVFALAALLLAPVLVRADSMEDDFAHPPRQMQPFVWWHWMGSNISKEGITKDLEAMKDSGIGGATIFNLTSCARLRDDGPPPKEDAPVSLWPDITYRSPRYWEMVEFAASEARRLGLEIGLHNCVGYSATGGPWVTVDQSMQKVVWTQTPVAGPTEFHATLATPKTFKDYYGDIAVLAVPDRAGVDGHLPVIQPGEIVDLTAKMQASGSVDWSVPTGKWVIVRLGYASTGATPHPMPEGTTALEVDKLDMAHSRFHFENVLGPLKEHLGPYFGKSFTQLTFDSYEAGDQSWSPSFREEFKKRKGYDPVPWLVMLGPTEASAQLPKSGQFPPELQQARVVGDAEQTARFNWDYKDVIAQLFQECNFAQGSQMLHAAGLQMQLEPYDGPFSTIAGSTVADLPMGEFWKAHGTGSIQPSIVGSAWASGHAVVGAESFTARPEVSEFTEDPASLKITAGGAFASGVSRMVLHHWVLQPFGDQFKPGMTMGWWGTHFGRNQTWYEPGKAFYAFLGRCQTMLQRGEGVSDFLAVDSGMDRGDAVDIPTFLKDVQVKNGQITLPSGRHYAFLAIPMVKGIAAGKMLPQVAEKMKSLIAAGAQVFCPKPESSPSLQGGPAADATVKQIADEVWGAGSLPPEGHAYGKGWISTNLETLRKRAVPIPDFEIASGPNSAVRWQHRHTADTEIYFLDNGSDAAQTFTARFRVTGKEPEFWFPVDGSRQWAGAWRDAKGVTAMDLSLQPEQTMFVVFRQPSRGLDPVVGVTANGQPDLNATVIDTESGVRLENARPAIDYVLKHASGKEQPVKTEALPAAIAAAGSWSLSFAPGQATPPSLDLPELVSLSLSADPGVKYYSGTVTYRKNVEVPAAFLSADRRVILDLGKVMNMAEVTVNGKKLGVTWYPPFRLDVTPALKAGTNTLEIAVTNTWHNRLVGDEQEPLDVRWGLPKPGRTNPYGEPLYEFPDWFLKGQPRPSQGRKCFTTWNYFTKDSPLLDAGLLGPVTLQAELNPLVK